jgi:CRP/FNR family nitrogen fixation transcriptional regulator
MTLADNVRPRSGGGSHDAGGPGASHGEAVTFSTEDLKLLHTIGSRMHFSRGETIFSEGDPADYAYQIVSGAVRLCKHMADGRRQIAQFLFPGHFFSFMDLTEHSFTAEAVNDAVLICYPLRQIERLEDERASLRKNFSAMLSRRVRDIQNHLVTLGRQTAKERLASFLIVIIEHSHCKNGGTIEVPMSRQDMADYLGLTIETVCRVLSAMKKQGILGIPNLHQLVVKKVDALYAIAGGGSLV